MEPPNADVRINFDRGEKHMQTIEKKSAKSALITTKIKSKLSSPINLSYAIIRHKDGSAISNLVKFIDIFDRPVAIEIPLSRFNNFNSCYKILLDAGYRWPKNIDQCRQLHQSWNDTPPRGW